MPFESTSSFSTRSSINDFANSIFSAMTASSNGVLPMTSMKFTSACDSKNSLRTSISRFRTAKGRSEKFYFFCQAFHFPWVMVLLTRSVCMSHTAECRAIRPLPDSVMPHRLFMKVLIPWRSPNRTVPYRWSRETKTYDRQQYFCEYSVSGIALHWLAFRFLSFSVICPVRCIIFPAKVCDFVGRECRQKTRWNPGSETLIISIPERAVVRPHGLYLHRQHRWVEYVLADY